MGTPMESWPRRHRITVDEYYRMAEIGVLAPDARVELIEGEIVDVAPRDSVHGSIVDQLTWLLTQAVGRLAIVRVQGAVRLSPITEPQPDVALLKPRADFYRHQQPFGTDTLLVIEVSDSTLRYDREVKAALYARYGAPELWIVDVRHSQLLACRSPVDGEYREQTSIDRPGVIAVGDLPGVTVDLSALFEP